MRVAGGLVLAVVAVCFGCASAAPLDPPALVGMQAIALCDGVPVIVFTYDLDPDTQAARQDFFSGDTAPFAVVTHDDAGVGTMVVGETRVVGVAAIVARWPSVCDVLAFARGVRT